jgi:hypothetical protein
MQHLEVSGAVVLYIGRTVAKGSGRKLNSAPTFRISTRFW